MTKRLLIVDDEETLTFSLYQSFIHSHNDYEVITAATGEEALDRIKEKPFDLIITDIFLPGINGIELLETVKKEHPHTRVVVITAYGSDEHKDDAMSKGADEYVEKPFDMKSFKTLVMNLLS